MIQKYLNNVLIMIENFNIRNNNWDFAFLQHLTHIDILKEIANSFNLELSIPINQVLI